MTNVWFMRTLLCFILLSIVSGCSSRDSRSVPAGYAHHSGDFAPFLSDTVAKYGGRVVASPPAVPRFDSEWWAKSDTNGFQILMPTNYQSGVEACMRRLFGEPVMSAGYPHLLYRSKDVGVTISAQTQLDPIHIIVTRAGVLHDERLPLGKQKTEP